MSSISANQQSLIEKSKQLLIDTGYYPYKLEPNIGFKDPKRDVQSINFKIRTLENEKHKCESIIKNEEHNNTVINYYNNKIKQYEDLRITYYNMGFLNDDLNDYINDLIRECEKSKEDLNISIQDAEYKINTTDYDLKIEYYKKELKETEDKYTNNIKEILSIFKPDMITYIQLEKEFNFIKEYPYIKSKNITTDDIRCIFLENNKYLNINHLKEILNNIDNKINKEDQNYDNIKVELEKEFRLKFSIMSKKLDENPINSVIMGNLKYDFEIIQNFYWGYYGDLWIEISNDKNNSPQRNPNYIPGSNKCVLLPESSETRKIEIKPKEIISNTKKSNRRVVIPKLI